MDNGLEQIELKLLRIMQVYIIQVFPRVTVNKLKHVYSLIKTGKACVIQGFLWIHQRESLMYI